MLKYAQSGGALFACGTCMDSRNIDPDDLRPRSTLADCLRLVEDAEQVLTIG